MAWDDCYTDRDYSRYCGYDLPDEPEESDEEPGWVADNHTALWNETDIEPSLKRRG